jgi:hypothetical protein
MFVSLWLYLFGTRYVDASEKEAVTAVAMESILKLVFF